MQRSADGSKELREAGTEQWGGDPGAAEEDARVCRPYRKLSKEDGSG